MPAVVTPVADGSFELRDYLHVLRRRSWVVAAAVAVTVGAALVGSFLREPVYEGEARVLLASEQGETLFDAQTGLPNDPQRHVATEIEVFQSALVRERVRDAIGSAPAVDVSGVKETDVISVSARHADAESAAAIADAYAEAYVAVKREQVLDSLLAAVTEVQSRIDELEREIGRLNEQVDAVPPDQRAEVEAEIAPLRDPLYSQQAAFRQTLEELQVRASLETGGARVVAAAEVPGSPVEPRPIRSGFLALALGLTLGIGVAFLFEYLDDSVRTKEDVERATDRLPVIGIVPLFSSPDPGRVALREPSSGASESFRSLRTAIQFMALEKPLHIVQATSSVAAEGKSTIVSNLGITFASTGIRTIVVDLDLRRPLQHEIFGLDNAVGFTSVLLGRASIDDAVKSLPGMHDMLSVLPSGPVPPNPAELLGIGVVDKLLRTLRDQYDLVLVDTPPLLPVTDALVVSRSVDAVLLLATAGMTSKRHLHRALELARQIEAPVVGTVMNRAGSSETYGYGTGYGYGYAPYPSKERDVNANGNRTRGRRSRRGIRRR